MEEKQLVPKRRFKEFKGEWKKKNFDEEIELYSGLTYSPNDVQQNGTFVLRSSNVQNGEIVSADDVYVDSEVVNSSNVREGDIIVVVRNGSRSLIGKHAKIKKSMDETVIGAFMTGIRSNQPNFINALLDTQNFKREIDKNLGATINQITNGMFKSMSFIIPNLEEQQKIGELFKVLDERIANQERKIAKAKALKTAYLTEMFPQEGETVPKRRFKGFEGEWKDTNLKNVGKSTSGTSLEKEFVKDGKYKVISIGSYSEKSIYTEQGIRVNLSDKTKDLILNKNDLTMILNDKTAAGNILGRVLLIDENNTYVYNQRTQRIEPNQEKFNSQFFYQMLNAPSIRSKIVRNSQGNTQIYINWSFVEQINYLIPNIEEQQKIGRFFKNFDNQIEMEEKKLDKLQKMKEAYLEEMFV